MAWQQMSFQTMPNLPANWGSGPTITVSGDLYTYRDTINNNARILLQFIVGPVSGASSFGYPIYGNAWVISDANLKQVQIKAASPSQWTSNLWGSLEWEIGNYDPNTAITIAQQFSTTSGRSPLSTSVSVTIPRLNVDRLETGNIWVANGNYEWKNCTLYVGINSEWKRVTAHIGSGNSYKPTKNSWQYLCDENSSFTISSTSMLSYGADSGYYVCKTLPAGTYTASTSLFTETDPAEGVVKKVYKLVNFQ